MLITVISVVSIADLDVRAVSRLELFSRVPRSDVRHRSRSLRVSVPHETCWSAELVLLDLQSEDRDLGLAEVGGYAQPHLPALTHRLDPSLSRKYDMEIRLHMTSLKPSRRCRHLDQIATD